MEESLVLRMLSFVPFAIALVGASALQRAWGQEGWCVLLAPCCRSSREAGADALPGFWLWKILLEQQASSFAQSLNKDLLSIYYVLGVLLGPGCNDKQWVDAGEQEERFLPFQEVCKSERDRPKQSQQVNRNIILRIKNFIKYDMETNKELGLRKRCY